jgi:hypothetical protein
MSLSFHSMPIASASSPVSATMLAPVSTSICAAIESTVTSA